MRRIIFGLENLLAKHMKSGYFHGMEDGIGVCGSVNSPL
jgi:hypothetical protein